MSGIELHFRGYRVVKKPENMQEANEVKEDDLEYFLEDTEAKMNEIFNAVHCLTSANYSLLCELQNQDWLQKIFYTVTGKNRLTADEIKFNHSRLQTYVMQLIEELYNRGAFGFNYLKKLGDQIRVLDKEHVELHENVNQIAKNQKSSKEQINYLWLLREIEAGKYEKGLTAPEVLSILVRISDEFISDTKMIELLTKKLSAAGIFDGNGKIEISEILNAFFETDYEVLKTIQAWFSPFIRNNILARVFCSFIEMIDPDNLIENNAETRERIIRGCLKHYFPEANSVTVKLSDFWKFVLEARTEKQKGGYKLSLYIMQCRKIKEVSLILISERLKDWLLKLYSSKSKLRRHPGMPAGGKSERG